jgi:deoxyribodipyrimidine photolyase
MKYTPFYQNALRYINSEKIFPDIDTKLFKVLGSSNKKLIKKFAGKSTVNFYGGRSEALKKIESYKKSHVNYLAIRDLPAENATTHLSAYLHFGVISPLEVVFMIKNKDIKKQILWREFYLYIIEHMPDYSKNSLTIERNNKIKWKGKNFKKWCDGQTGIPFIDAGMRELNETGYMQNRMRMNVAMFLIFYLQVDWRQGEQYFAQNLVDYDYCNNLGGWLWSSSWEVHSNDYYRVFSMSSQMQRFDKDGEYVKKWVPELKDIPVKHLYDWDKNYMNYDLKKLGYCPPLITDLSQSRREGIELYRA